MSSPSTPAMRTLATRCVVRERGSSAQWSPPWICCTRLRRIALPSSNQLASPCSARTRARAGRRGRCARSASGTARRRATGRATRRSAARRAARPRRAKKRSTSACSSSASSAITRGPVLAHQARPVRVERALVVLGDPLGDRDVAAEPLLGVRRARAAHRQLVVERVLARDHALRRRAGPAVQFSMSSCSTIPAGPA